MKLKKRPDHSITNFLKRTVAAQTHLITCGLAILGTIFLLPLTQEQGPLHYFGALVFGVSATLLFAASAVYHLATDGFESSPKLAFLLESLDHFAIYLLIAGTYTPFLINAVASPWQEILLWLVWSMAFVGILYSAFKHKLPAWAQSRFVYTLVYLVMGWTLAIRIGEIYDRLTENALLLLVGGALCYTVGAVVYITKKPRLFHGVFGFHELWHLFVSLGFFFHFALIVGFYL